MATEWYQSHTSLVEFAGWMVEEHFFTTPGEVVDFMEKPWKWTAEYQKFRDAEAKAAVAPHVMEMFKRDATEVRGHTRNTADGPVQIEPHNRETTA